MAKAKKKATAKKKPAAKAPKAAKAKPVVVKGVRKVPQRLIEGELPELMGLYRPDKDLAALIGEEPRPRSLALRQTWIWLKRRAMLQGENKDEIYPDDMLKRVVGDHEMVKKKTLRDHVYSHCTPA